MRCCWYKGFTLSETISWRALWAKEHPHEYRDALFSARTLDWSHDLCHSLHLFMISVLGLIVGHYVLFLLNYYYYTANFSSSSNENMSHFSTGLPSANVYITESTKLKTSYLFARTPWNKTRGHIPFLWTYICCCCQCWEVKASIKSLIWNLYNLLVLYLAVSGNMMVAN